MRIAFLTPEHPIDYPDGGGLGTYVQRMSTLLAQMGHEPEVFVSSSKCSDVAYHHNVRVQRVNRSIDHEFVETIRRNSQKFIRIDAWRYSAPWILNAFALAKAMERRHTVKPYTIVQSADYLASGLFVKRRPSRLHVVRCSTAADLYSKCDQTWSAVEWWRSVLERRSMRQADVVYAPSRYLADYFWQNHGLKVRVIRPPIGSDFFQDLESEMLLPGRYFFHFGQLTQRKGTSLLAEALPIAWKSAPDITMVWSGRWEERDRTNWMSLWGNRRDQVYLTGPLTRGKLQTVLKRADLSVLPSQVDNLPNTVIESLMCGIPVLGSRGASIDELVEENITGHLVPLGNVHALADALVRFWTRKSSVKKGFAWNSNTAKEMHPEAAVSSLLSLVDSAGSS